MLFLTPKQPWTKLLLPKLQQKKTKAAATSAATEAETKAKQSAIAADEAKKSAAVAAESAKKAAAKAAEAQAAEDELKAALADLKSQEDAYAKKTKELEQKSEGSGVAAMRAKNELAQHLGEDPLPLRKAKLTTEAATKKAEKARVAAEDSSKVAQKAKDEAEAAAAQAQAAKAAADNAHKVAQKAKEEAEAAAAQAEADRVAAEAAVVEAEKALEEAQEALEAAKKKGGPTHGTFWWLEREIAERKKYMPKTGKAKLNF